jgi:hypothetical protein
VARHSPRRATLGPPSDEKNTRPWRSRIPHGGNQPAARADAGADRRRLLAAEELLDTGGPPPGRVLKAIGSLLERIDDCVPDPAAPRGGISP